MLGWIEHTKWYVPGWSNSNENVSFVSMAAERNAPLSLTTVCGSSSLFSHVTVVPTFTVDDIGWSVRHTAAAATFETMTFETREIVRNFIVGSFLLRKG